MAAPNLNIEPLPNNRYLLVDALKQREGAYAAWGLDTMTDRPILSKSRDWGEESVERLRIEAEALDSLSHPQIPGLVEASLDEGVRPYIVTNLIPGPHTLEKAKKHPNPNLAARIGLSALRPLGHVHDRSIIHRDIKPENLALPVSITPTSIVDFDISLINGVERLPYAAGKLKCVGTVDFTAPEVFRGEGYDCRVDLYSLGITMYELLFGEPPFASRRGLNVIWAHMEDPLDFSQANARQIPNGLLDIVERATQKNPDDRYQSAEAMAEDLTVYLAA